MQKRMFILPIGLVSLTLLAGCGQGIPPLPGELPSGPVSYDPAVWNDHTHGLPFVYGYQKGINEAKIADKPVMLFVTTTWCGWCKKLAADNFENAEIRKLLEDNFVLVIVDGDSEKAVVTEYGVQGFPALFFETAEGHRLGEVPGYVPPEEFKPIVEQALNKVG